VLCPVPPGGRRHQSRSLQELRRDTRTDVLGACRTYDATSSLRKTGRLNGFNKR
jgi:hypothetical protein